MRRYTTHVVHLGSVFDLELGIARAEWHGNRKNINNLKILRSGKKKKKKNH